MQFFRRAFSFLVSRIWIPALTVFFCVVGAGQSDANLIFTGAILNPLTLPIGGGFVNPTAFNFTLNFRNDFDNQLDVTGLNIQLVELDVFDSTADLLLSFDVNFPAPHPMPNPGAILNLVFNPQNAPILNVPAATLNGACPGGCASFFGKLAELGSLEFGVR